MIENWLATDASTALLTAVSGLVAYLAILVLTRIGGLRSFAKISSFDFAVTVAIGSVLATAILTADPPLARAVVALSVLYLTKIGVARLRLRYPGVRRAVDNSPLLLMDGSRVLEDNLRRVRLTQGDLRAKLREANVLRLTEVRAVVMETTGDVSVLHGDPDGPDLDRALLEGVRGVPEESESSD